MPCHCLFRTRHLVWHGDVVVCGVQEGPVLVVRVWGDQVEAIDQGEEAAKWFSTFLHKVVHAPTHR